MNPNNPLMDQQNEIQKSQALRFSEILKVIKHRRILVGLLLFFALSGTFLGHFIYTPTYTASTRIAVKTERSGSLADVLGAGQMLQQNNIGERIHNYVQYIKSNQFMLQIAQNIKFKTFNNPLILEAPQNLSMFKVDFWYWAARYVVGEKVKPMRKNDLKYDPMSMTIEQIAGFLEAVTKVNTNHADHVAITVTTLDPFTSMTLANTIAKEFSKITNEHDARGILEVKKLVDDKLVATKEALKAAELELIEFRKQNRVTVTASQSTVYSNRINQVEQEIDEIKLQLEENQKLLDYYKAERTKRIQTVGSSSKSSRSDNRTQMTLLNQQLDQLKKQRSLMTAQGYQPNHWRVKEVSQEIQGVAKELEGLLVDNDDPALANETNSSLQSKIDQLNTDTKKLERRLSPLQKSKKQLFGLIAQIPQAEQYQLMLKRKVDLEYQNFALLQKKQNDIEIQLVSIDKKVLIDQLSALPGPSKRRSLPVKLVFSLLVGLFFSCMIALLLEYLDNSIRHKSDFEELGIHFLGEIPDTQGHLTRKNNVKSPAQLVTLNDPDSLDSVVFDFVRSRIESVRTRSGSSSNSLTVTSVRPSEGKSFICSNLAVSLSQLGKKTLLIDADLRCPSVHCYFNLTNDQGLTDLFESSVGLEEVLHKNVTPNLDIFTAGWGCKNPTVLVSSEKFRILMKFLRNEYDYIIVDTPPIGAVADASIISNMTDGIAIVAKYRQTTKHDIQDAQFKIHQMSSKRMFGIINFASNRENIVTYYPYVVPKTHQRDEGRGAPTPKSDDIQRFEDQLRKKRIG